MKKPLDTAQWISFFERNQIDRRIPRWDHPILVDEACRPLLEQSLREFQLGDGGGPAGLIAWNAKRYRTSEPGLEQVIDLWFKEEEEHSRLLAGLLQRFEVDPIQGHWSFSAFCFFRWALGVRFELQILTLTELSSSAYYWLLLRHCPDPAVRDVCSIILRDETGHLSFQKDRLIAAGANGKGWRGWFWQIQFWASGLIAAGVLWTSHGRCLSRLGATLPQYLKEVFRHFSKFTAGLQFTHSPSSPTETNPLRLSQSPLS